MFETRSWLVPGTLIWRVRRIRRDGHTVAVRARHRLWFWQTITVQTRDLRFGAEAVARYLQGRPAGYPLQDNRTWQSPWSVRSAQR